MLLTRSQFNIRHLVEVSVFCACAYVLVHIDAAAGVLILLPCFPGFGFDRSTGRTSARGGRTLYRCIVLAAFGLIYFTYFYFYPDPLAVRDGIAAMVICSVFVTAPIWISGVSRLYKAITMGPGYQMPPTDRSCGPIAWRGFGDGLEPQAKN
jgi:hypothetical protein